MGQMLAIEYLNAEDMVEGNCGFALQDRTYVVVGGGGGGGGGVARTEVDCLSVWATIHAARKSLEHRREQLSRNRAEPPVSLSLTRRLSR